MAHNTEAFNTVTHSRIHEEFLIWNISVKELLMAS